jgi:hypothetical protein
MYGISAARWPTYQRRNLMAAYISAGVAARLLSRPWNQLDAEIRNAQARAQQKYEKGESTLEPDLLTRRNGDMSHHPRLEYARVWCNTGDRNTFVPKAIEILESLKKDHPHVLQIDEELVLQRLEMQQWQQADAILHEVKRRYYRLSEEMLCRFGRMWKDQGAQIAWKVSDAAAAHEYFPRSLSWYKRAYEIRANYYPGINVATLCYILGDKEKARDLAREILARLTSEPETSELLWIEATRGEANLLLGDCETDDTMQAEANTNAERHYRYAASRMPARDRSTMRRQAKLILRYSSAKLREFWTEERRKNAFACDTQTELAS